jgi:hypothetical protein
MLPGWSRPFLGADGFYPSYGRWWASSSWRCSGLFLASCSTIRRPGDPPAFHLVARLIVSISSAHSPRLPPLFLRRRGLTALLADLAGRASSAWGLTRPRHPLSTSTARFATAPPASLLAPDRTGAAFAPVLSAPWRSAEGQSFSQLPQRSYARLSFVVLWACQHLCWVRRRIEISISPGRSVGRAQWWARQGSNLQPSASKADALSR